MDAADIKELYTWLDERMNSMGQAQREQHARLRDDMQRGFGGMNSRLDMLNGKTNEHESELAVLKDRSDRSERQAGIVGTITGAGSATLVMLIKAWFSGNK